MIRTCSLRLLRRLHKVAFSKKQLQILSFPNSSYDALICDGSIRAGKTSIMSTAFILWAMRDFNGCNFGICSKTIGTAERNIVLPLVGMDYLQKRYSIQYKLKEKLIISDGKHKNTFYIFGGKDAASYQLIQGITLAGVLLDEVALMPKSFVDQALARCSVSGSKFWFNCNPEGQLHWFNQDWILKAESHNALHLHFTMEDNPSLDTKIRQRYESQYSGVFYDRYIKGLWVSAEGVVYANMFNSETNVLSPDEISELQFEGDYYVSCDFGIQNATVWLLWRKVRGAPVYVCLRESYYSGRESKRQKTVTELLDGLEEMLDGIQPKHLIIDTSASALKVEAIRRKYHVLGGKNDVLNGIAHTGKMLQDGYLLFSSDCKHTLREFELYMWDEKAAANGHDTPVKDNDHCMDAVRYFVSTEYLYQKCYGKK